MSEPHESLVFKSKKNTDLKRDSNLHGLEPDPMLKEDYISFLENIYDEVLNARIRFKDTNKK